MMITDENWTHCLYRSNKLKSFICLGGRPAPAVPGKNENNVSVSLSYEVTVLDDSDSEVFQHSFQTLEKAISFSNERYGSWDFHNQEQAPTATDEGCGSCSAH